MSKLPVATGKQVIKALVRAGFVVTRIHGSHHFLRHADGRTTTLPVHGKETLGPGLMGKYSATRNDPRGDAKAPLTESLPLLTPLSKFTAGPA